MPIVRVVTREVPDFVKQSAVVSILVSKVRSCFEKYPQASHMGTVVTVGPHKPVRKQMFLF